MTAGFNSAVGPALSVFESGLQLNLSILPASWAKRIEVDSVSQCWVWTGAHDVYGYGRIVLGSKYHKAHRLIYSHFFDDIDFGPVLDHRCHEADKNCSGGPTCIHRRCVNPLHLMPSSVQDNNRRGRRWERVELRKTHCVHGHAFTKENTIIAPPGGRRCKTCKRTALRKWYVNKYGEYKSPSYELMATKLHKPINVKEV